MPSAQSRDGLVAEIQSRLARIKTESPFSLLNIKPHELDDKSEQDITDALWRAYESSAKRWNPERCPEHLHDLKQGMAKIYAAIGEAFSTLAEPDERERAVAEHIAKRAGAASGGDLTSTLRSAGRSSVDPSSSGERSVELLLPAIELYARSLVALSEQRADEALRLCHAALSAEPNNPDFLATMVWIRASMERPDLKVLLVELDELLQGAPSHVSGRYYRGVLRRRMGDDTGARLDFEQVLSADPGHAGARNQLDSLADSAQSK